ncbi:MAG: FtsW/RodA/SpoVE family cell cycle protein [Bacilli bacterium]|jgi:cell division protein FtsW|nr:FtsW/RodA/SpoVE family cell cycle protein [Bacilli bacterium]
MNRLLARMDKPLFIIMLILFITGLIMIFSASTITSFMRFQASPYSFFIKQGLFLIIGLLTFFFIIKIPLKNYKNYIGILMGGIIFSLFFLFIYATTINYSLSWYRIGGFFSIQPSEFAKVILILFLAIYYNTNKTELNKYRVVLLPLGLALLIVSLVLFQPDLGTAVILASLTLFLFLAIPVDRTLKSKIINLLFGMVIVMFLVIIASGKTFLSSTQRERLYFQNPCQRYETSGYQVCNGYIAINNGGLFGVGLGKSTQKYLYLPEAHTDFIFAIVIEELGLIVGLVILFLLLVVLYRILIIARRSHHLRDAVIAYGVFFYILLHIIVNLTGLLGLLPLTGVPLPFFSYGGSYTLNLFIALALVQRVNIETYYHNKNKSLR